MQNLESDSHLSHVTISIFDLINDVDLNLLLILNNFKLTTNHELNNNNFNGLQVKHHVERLSRHYLHNQLGWSVAEQLKIPDSGSEGSRPVCLVSG